MTRRERPGGSSLMRLGGVGLERSEVTVIPTTEAPQPGREPDPRVNHHGGQHELTGAESVSDRVSDQVEALLGHVKKKEGARETAERRI